MEEINATHHLCFCSPRVAVFLHGRLVLEWTNTNVTIPSGVFFFHRGLPFSEDFCFLLEVGWAVRFALRFLLRLLATPSFKRAAPPYFDRAFSFHVC